MGSYADIRINNHELLWWKNTYDKWYFTKQDRVRKISNTDEEGSFIGYEVDAKILRKRLKLAGHDLRSAEKDFNDTIALWASEMKEAIEYHQNLGSESSDSYHTEAIKEVRSELCIFR